MARRRLRRRNRTNDRRARRANFPGQSEDAESKGGGQQGRREPIHGFIMPPNSRKCK